MSGLRHLTLTSCHPEVPRNITAPSEPTGRRHNPLPCGRPLPLASHTCTPPRRDTGVCAVLCGFRQGHPLVSQMDPFRWLTHVDNGKPRFWRRCKRPASSPMPRHRPESAARPSALTAGRTRSCRQVYGCARRRRGRPPSQGEDQGGQRGHSYTQGRAAPRASSLQPVERAQIILASRRRNLRSQRSRRPSRERLRVTSSAYSRWPPTGSPCARRVRRMPWGLTRRAR